MNKIHLLAALPALALLAFAAPNAQARSHASFGTGLGAGLGLGIGFGIGSSLVHNHYRSDRYCSAYHYEPCYSHPVYVEHPVYVSRPVYVEPTIVERPVYVDRQVYVDRPVMVDRPVEVEKVVERVVEKTVERPVHVDREIRVENGKTTIRESVDGTLQSITHSPANAQPLSADAEMALLCNIRDTLNQKLPMEVARIQTHGDTRTVEVILRATRFAPYDRVTRRFVISAQKLTAAGSNLTIRFNANGDGLQDLALDFQDLLRKMGADCQSQGGNWFMDNRFDNEPAQAQARPLNEVLAALPPSSTH